MGDTELVATIPVPASPSGGQTGICDCSLPDKSKNAAPSSVRYEPFSPAFFTNFLQNIFQYKNEHDIYEFNDIAHMAIKVVKENEDIREELSNSFNEILVDATKRGASDIHFDPYEQFLKTYDLAREADFSNINVDLMSGIPYQTTEKFLETLEKIVTSLNEKLNLMNATVAESTTAISDSAIKLEDLAGASRQQMIDLMSDYAKAVNTMQTLNKQMMVARASAPMDAIKAAPMESFGHVSAQDFLAQSEKMFEKLHEQSMDLTRAVGAEIPDVVWKKYHSGDKTIFSKWLAKMLNAAEKKQIRDMMKNDAVFRSQATQFVRSFDKILSAAQQADNSDKVSATLIKTDPGQIYISLKSYV